jgi:hypothetical protein
MYQHLRAAIGEYGIGKTSAFKPGEHSDESLTDIVVTWMTKTVDGEQVSHLKYDYEKCLKMNELVHSEFSLPPDPHDAMQCGTSFTIIKIENVTTHFLDTWRANRERYLRYYSEKYFMYSAGAQHVQQVLCSSVFKPYVIAGASVPANSTPWQISVDGQLLSEYAHNDLKILMDQISLQRDEIMGTAYGTAASFDCTAYCTDGGSAGGSSSGVGRGASRRSVRGTSNYNSNPLEFKDQIVVPSPNSSNGKVIVHFALYYFPSKGGSETLPPGPMTQLDGAGARYGIGGASGEELGLKGRRPGLLTLWMELFLHEAAFNNGTKSPYCEDGKLRFMLRKSGGRVPEACYDRVKGFMYLGAEFRPDAHKKYINNTNELWNTLCAGSDETGGLSSIANQFAGSDHLSLNNKFVEWLKVCHKFDEDLKFENRCMDTSQRVIACIRELQNGGTHEFWLWERMDLAGKGETKKSATAKAKGRGGAKEDDKPASLRLKPGDRVHVINSRKQIEYGTVYRFMSWGQEVDGRGRVLVLPVSETLGGATEDYTKYDEDVVEKCEDYDVLTELQAKLDTSTWKDKVANEMKKLPAGLQWCGTEQHPFFESKSLDEVKEVQIGIKVLNCEGEQVTMVSAFKKPLEVHMKLWELDEESQEWERIEGLGKGDEDVQRVDKINKKDG